MLSVQYCFFLTCYVLSLSGQAAQMDKIKKQKRDFYPIPDLNFAQNLTTSLTQSLNSDNKKKYIFMFIHVRDIRKLSVNLAIECEQALYVYLIIEQLFSCSVCGAPASTLNLPSLFLVSRLSWQYRRSYHWMHCLVGVTSAGILLTLICI